MTTTKNRVLALNILLKMSVSMDYIQYPDFSINRLIIFSSKHFCSISYPLPLNYLSVQKKGRTEGWTRKKKTQTAFILTLLSF